MTDPIRVRWYARWATLPWLYLKRPFLRRRLRRPGLVRVDGMTLIVTPGVHHPVIFRSGVLLARAIAEHAGRRDARQGNGRPAVLDVGTGSGIGAIAAARCGFDAVGVDVHPDAVRCARANAILNDVADRVTIHHGDLFAPVSDRRFDLVTFNPPFYRGVPRDDADRAWRSPDVIERFAAGLAGALHPGGTALVLVSTDGDQAGILRALRDNALDLVPLLQRDLGNEIMTVYAVTPA